MKNLLALVFALVMTLGLATVGANAALSDYSDAKSIDADYNTAFSVMNAVGVFQGDGNNLTPTANLTRAQAAKIIAYLDLGESTAEALPAVQVFDDVPATHWAAKYVAYGKEAGILQSNGGNNFDPDGELTGYMFGAYMLAVLGYDRNTEGMTGNTWAIKTATLMENNDINDGVDKAGSAVLTREEAAQYAFNTLQADMVFYDGGSTVTVAGIPVVSGATRKLAGDGTNGYGNLPNANAARWDASDATYAGARAAHLQLGEKLYGYKLRPYGVKNALGEPVTNWYYLSSGSSNNVVTNVSGSKLATEQETPTLSFVVSSTSGELATLGGQLRAKNSDFVVGSNMNTPISASAQGFTNAETPTTTRASLKVNGNFTIDVAPNYRPYVGDIVEVYTYSGNANAIERVVVYSYSLVKIAKVDTNVSTTDKNANPAVSAYITLKNDNGSIVYKDTAISGYDASTYVKDAYVAAVISEAAATTAILKSEIVTLTEGAVSAYNNASYTLGGTKYNLNTNATKYKNGAAHTPVYDEYTNDDFTGTYGIALDPNGYALGIVEVKAGQVASDAVYAFTAAGWATPTTVYGETSYTFYRQIVDMEGTLSNVVTGQTIRSNGSIYGVDNAGFAYTLVSASSHPAYAALTGYYYVTTDGTIKAATNSTNPTDAVGYDSTGAGTAAGYANVKLYTRSTGITQYGLYTLSEKSGTGYAYSAFTPYTGNGSTVRTELGAGSAGGGTTAGTITSDSTRVDTTTDYITSATKFIVISGTGSTAKTGVFTGKTTIRNTSDDTAIIATKNGSAWEATYVLLPTSSSTISTGSLSDMFYVKSTSGYQTTDDGYALDVYNLAGEKVPVTVSGVPGTDFHTGFVTWTQNATTGVYTLTDATTSPTDSYSVDQVNDNLSSNWDKQAMFDTGVTFRDYYNGKLSLVDSASSKVARDITVPSTAVVVDLHETNEDAFHWTGTNYTAKAGLETYNGTVSSVAEISDLPSEYTTTLALAVNKDGVVVIYVTEISRTALRYAYASYAAGNSGTATVSSVTIKADGSGTGTIDVVLSNGGVLGDTVTIYFSATSGTFSGNNYLTGTTDGTNWTLTGSGTHAYSTYWADAYGNNVNFTVTDTP